MARQSAGYTFDAELEFKDAGLVAADAAGTVDAAARVVDVGPGRVNMALVIDVTAVEIASNDEVYHVIVQGSNDDFTTKVELGSLTFGATEVQPGGAPDSVAGRYELLFCNEQNGTIYEKLRVYTDVAGAIATGINFSAWGAKL